jgi:KUP system potassium uptake protein
MPSWSQMPMVVLATAATVIASQAVISGAFSLTHQAVQLGFLPRLTIRHTSEHEAGQVYAPAVNWCLAVVTAALVVGFGSSVGLAGAYGIAVTGTMTITTVLFFFVVLNLWRKPLWMVIAGAAVFLTVDLALFSASLTKVPHGGWLPLSLGLAMFVVLTTWDKGRQRVDRIRAEEEGPLRAFVEEVRRTHPPACRARTPAVFLHADRETTPLALRANLEHNEVLHESVVIVLIRTLKVPHVVPSERVVVDDLGYRDDGITHLTASFGFRDRQNLPEALALAARRGLETTVDPQQASYFISRVTLVATDAPAMARWRERLFITMARNEADPARYFALPDERTVTMGYVIEL